MESVRVGIIGTGKIAQHHLRVLGTMQDVQICAVANRGLERRLATAKEFNVPAQYGDFREMLEKEDLDAIFILVNAENIVPVLRSCLPYRKPIFVEKPVGRTAHETRQLAVEAAQYDVQVMVGFNRRFYSVITGARDAIMRRGSLMGIAAEAPERIREKRATGKFSSEELDEWFLLNGIHMVDLVRFLGGELVNVHALRTACEEKQGDNFAALMSFTSGAIGQYRSHWLSPGKWQLDLYGDGVRAHLEPIEEGILLHDEAEPLVVSEEDKRFKPGFFAQDRYFVDCVKKGSAIELPAASLEDAAQTMELLEAIRGI